MEVRDCVPGERGRAGGVRLRTALAAGGFYGMMVEIVFEFGGV